MQQEVGVEDKNSVSVDPEGMTETQETNTGWLGQTKSEIQLFWRKVNHSERTERKIHQQTPYHLEPVFPEKFGDSFVCP